MYLCFRENIFHEMQIKERLATQPLSNVIIYKFEFQVDVK